jgi:hypothetical protein
VATASFGGGLDDYDDYEPAENPIINCDTAQTYSGSCTDGSFVVNPDGETPDLDDWTPPPPPIYSCESPNSFVTGTRVLMADDTTRAIEDIKIGDQVVATDPKMGRTEAKPVTALISGNGAKHLVKITVDVDGAGDTATDDVTATDNHPFWVPALRQWVDAEQLQPGMWLRTSAGTHVQITAIKAWVAVERVHNLTIDGLHTYHVLAGDQAILVHNTGPGDRERGPDGRFLPNPNPLDPDSRYDRVSLWEKTKRDIRSAAPTDANGDFIDPNTGQVIPKGGPFHYGHKPGHEYWRARDWARENGLSREDFIAHQNNADNYQIEDPSSNMSHRYESPC